MLPSRRVWLLEDDICSSKDDLLLLDTLNSVEVATVDWDVAVSSVDVSDSSVYSDGDSSTFNVDVDVELGFYFKLDCVAATDVLVEADVFAILDCLEISQAILDCEMKALLGGVSNNSNADADILQFV
ncbi:hypothetical protein F441_15585 [Phytophthora nicotianae CJ01A1]|uniref:Uncharacterized protein n=3 Tax=Phytophthora nicotianae TaxID=4792 RepID=W2IDQ2_PHYNI|nr:hypothetical protein L915_15307 [Phytophthora nicotianae]ETL32180.1 hypothetical protein L916_15198 [Phytophthora nicotianae]ETO67329.1 hypothetical protein F444_15741 [Phytophthora nicotianae P1976]ETP08436.1 hypothetical protein F441_15585 [Phytophthora nicotianae CJ01A1]